ncbi:MAG: DEAD/DEAH box helicase [Lentisphaerae bacterium]|jgi:ATP-dependent RNA helicase RhlE|nr:DEAD/DEAH box helicase [Lentisphaerota bacterium]MBT4819947.1 DEAD/DEAH box helicase [Lentisphaerota bacterium]MBT5605597.1 DEAD/DEAH box helicase [Lentisphaerota bacterium]MBT7062284.1 DEAD/DEAH box helicase [Lentisphaerota bacterium]MBT7842309.1 DEAD/DEAH box helicase [Lentisphaerota bacterium]
MSFDSFQLHSRLNANIRALGYREPTPIQTQAIPVVMEGRDVLGLAQTGTGKTAAFALPILNRLQEGPGNRLRALVVAPTRELAQQIYDAFGEFGRGTGCRGVTLYGGVGINPQIQKLRRGVDIAVSCPGRLLDHMQRGTINLRHIDTLVLDEADQMFDMGFLPAIRNIVRQLPKQRQNLLFSATMPDDIRGLANEILRNPETIRAGFIAPAETVSHALYPVEQHLKRDLLLELLKHTDTESVLIFTRTKHRAKRIGEQLEKAGHKATSIQGNLSQNRRQAAMDGFRNGRYQILVATDIAARGIDVSGISHVINFDIPDTVDAYTHRIGRTGRAAKTGDAFTLVAREDMDIVRRIERVLGSPIERRRMEGFDYNAPRPARSGFERGPRTPRRSGAQRGPSSHDSGRSRSSSQGNSSSGTGGGRHPQRHRTSSPASRDHGSSSHGSSSSRSRSSQGNRPPRTVYSSR